MANKDSPNKETKEFPYMNSRQAAEAWGISIRRISKLCLDGRVAGAKRVTRMWFIPVGTPKPPDIRGKTKGGGPSGKS